MWFFEKTSSAHVVYAMGVGVAVLFSVGAVVWFGVGVWVSNRPSPLSVVLQDVSGEEVPLQSVFDGRPAIINTWASWCPYCAREMPDFVQLQKEFPNIHIVGINRAEEHTVAEAYIQRVDPERMLTYLFDPTDTWYRSVGGYVMPETVFISADGGVLLHRRGVLSLEEMRDLTEKLLQQDLAGEDAGSSALGCTGLSCVDHALDDPS